MRSLLLWLLGVPIPIIILIALFARLRALVRGAPIKAGFAPACGPPPLRGSSN